MFQLSMHFIELAIASTIKAITEEPFVKSQLVKFESVAIQQGPISVDLSNSILVVMYYT